MQRNFIVIDEAKLENISSARLELLLEQSRASTEELNNENMLLQTYLQTFDTKRKFVSSENIFESTEILADLANIKSGVADPPGAKNIIKLSSAASSELSDSMALWAALTDDVTSKSSIFLKQIALPDEEKCEIASMQIRELTEKIAKLHNSWFRKLSPFKVRLEEVTICERELQQDISDFKRDVIQSGKNPATGAVLLEKVNFYFNRSTKFKEVQIGRSRLEYFFLKNLEKKVEEELKQREALGSALEDIDYRELKIDNFQYVEKMEEKNQALLVTKRHMNVILQLLRQYKVKLQHLVLQDRNLREQIQKQRDNIARIEREIETSAAEKNKARRNVHHLKHQLEIYRVPDTMDYVHIQAELYDLQKVINVWQRRLQIAEVSAKCF